MQPSWDCRIKLLKQNPVKPTTPRNSLKVSISPGPQEYNVPNIIGGKGYSKIRRAPAFTFAHRTPTSNFKPATSDKAILHNVRGLYRTGRDKIPQGLVSTKLEPLRETNNGPGPGKYAPNDKVRYKSPPAYSLRVAARPPHEPEDTWTPPPNMYCPDKPHKNAPAYSFGYPARSLKPSLMPGPGEHDPNFDYVDTKKPAFSFGAPYRSFIRERSPPPNNYCEKKFLYPKRTMPAPSFGIRHSPFVGQQQEYLKSSQTT